MQTLQVDKAEALKAYSQADYKSKEILKTLFGQDVFLQKITDRVKSFEDACVVLGIKPEDVLPEKCIDSKSVIAYCKLIIIARALNEGWTPNWKDEDEYKYYPWFYIDKGASGFCLYLVNYHFTSSNVRSRLCFKNEELAEYAVKQFLDLYKDYMTM